MAKSTVTSGASNEPRVLAAAEPPPVPPAVPPEPEPEVKESPPVPAVTPVPVLTPRPSSPASSAPADPAPDLVAEMTVTAAAAVVKGKPAPKEADGG